MESAEPQFLLYPIRLESSDASYVMRVDTEESICQLICCESNRAWLEHISCHFSLEDSRNIIVINGKELDFASNYIALIRDRFKIEFEGYFESVASIMQLSEYSLQIKARNKEASVELRVRDVCKEENAIFVAGHELRVEPAEKQLDFYNILLAAAMLRMKLEAEIQVQLFAASIEPQSASGETDDNLEEINDINNKIEEFLLLQSSGSPNSGQKLLFSESAGQNSQEIGTMTLRRKHHKKRRHHRKAEEKSLPTISPVLNEAYIVEDIEGNEIEFDLYHQIPSEPIVFVEEFSCERRSTRVRNIRISQQQFCSLGQVTLEFVCDDLQLFLNFGKAQGVEIVAAFTDWRRKSRIRSVE